MAESPKQPIVVSTPQQKLSLVPWTRFRQWRQAHFQRERAALGDYFRLATPIALKAHDQYSSWQFAVAEPIQDTQKAANASATLWWRVAEALRRFEELVPPASARKYHKVFGEAMRNANLGSEAAKNGFRSNKTYEVSRGLGFLDRFVELMGEAEFEMGRLVKKYRLTADS